MKATIRGKRYDTANATLIGEANSYDKHTKGDFAAWEAGLYRTPRGAYFLAGWGGPLSIFAHHIAGGRLSGSCIIPLAEAQALQWAEANLPIETVEHYFSDQIEDA